MSEAEDRRPTAIRIGKLDTVGAIRAEVARLCRAGRRGELPPADASRLSNVLSLVAKLIEGGEFERRLEQVEARLSERGRT